MRFSLIIPCYNEAKNIPLLLERCKWVSQYSDIEVILVDNGSTDETQSLLSKLLPQYPGCYSIRVSKNQGYGFGILSGLQEAKGDILGWTHADMQTDPMDCLLGLDFFKIGNKDVFVKGKRFGRPWIDVFFTIGMSFFETFLLRKPMWDINAQPTMFTKNFFNKWNNPPYDFSLDLYAYFQAHCNNITIKRFPVKFEKRAFGVSHWNVNWAAKRKFIVRTVEFSLKLKKKIST